MWELIQQDFFQRALLGIFLVSIICGYLGSFTVIKQFSSISGGLSHAAFGGIGIGYFFGFSPELGAILFCIVCALLMSQIYFSSQASLENLVSLIWSLGISLGVILIALKGGSTSELQQYLFGSIVLVDASYIFKLSILAAFVLGFFIYFQREIKSICFDEDFAKVLGVKVKLLHSGVMVLIAISTVFLINIVGAIMSLALLTIPSLIALKFSKNLQQVFLFSFLTCLFCATSGLLISSFLEVNFHVPLPPGPCIITFLSFVYLLSLLAPKFKS